MKKIIIIIGATIVIAAAAAAVFIISRRAAPSPTDWRRYVAMVAGQGITREDFNAQYAIMSAFYRYSQPAATIPASLKQDSLTLLINRQLVANFARQNGIAISANEVESAYANILKNQKTEENAYIGKIRTMYGIDKNTHLKELGQELLREKVQTRLNKDITVWLKEQRQQVKVEIVSQL